MEAGRAVEIDSCMVKYGPMWTKGATRDMKTKAPGPGREISSFVLRISCVAAKRFRSLTAGKQRGKLALLLTFREFVCFTCVVTTSSVFKIPTPGFKRVSLAGGGIRKEVRRSRAKS